ncbi:MAG: hypothetical protein KAH72_04625 [Flavobacteriaceae bacterium]|nr:hypothetical protein [Flavobacteriaceae bacterium]
MTINDKILKLPSEQLSWILLVKKIFKNTFNSGSINKSELIFAIKNKAIERGYDEFDLLLDSRDIE